MSLWRSELSEPIANEWSELPILLKVEEAAAVLRVGRSKAYEMTTLYETSGGTQGLPVLRFGDLLRIPRFALHEFVTTGRIVQLIPPVEHATPDATPARKPSRTGRRVDGSQLSLLGSD
jgi:excisionase family DNA binding protein